MINSYHTHVAYCKHAVGSVEDYVKKAIELGMEEIAITDHVPVPDCFYDDEAFKAINRISKMNYNQINDYLSDLDAVKMKYKDKIKIYTGFECEYYEKLIPVLNELKDKVDFFNFGLHHFYYEDKLYNSFSSQSMDKDGIIAYGKLACEALDSKLFKCFVHPDLFLSRYIDSPFDSLCEEITRNICKSAIRNNVYLEFNCNKLRNYIEKGIPYWYPNESFWKIVAEYKEIKVLIGSDAHNPEYLYDEAVQYGYNMAKKLNLNIVDKIDIIG